MNLSSVPWQWVAYVFGLVVLVAAAAILFYAFRRGTSSGAGASGDAMQRKRARLALVDSFHIDRHRKLLLLRRDGVEHLVMIGGPNDVLIEASIRRVAAQPGRGAVSQAVAGAAEAHPIAAQREPAPPVRQAPARGEPAPADALPRNAPQPATVEQRAVEHAIPANPPPRGATPTPVPQPPQPQQRVETPPADRGARVAPNSSELAGESLGTGSPQRRTPDADLAAMAHKLEAALRRPAASPPAPAPVRQPQPPQPVAVPKPPQPLAGRVQPAPAAQPGARSPEPPQKAPAPAQPVRTPTPAAPPRGSEPKPVPSSTQPRPEPVSAPQRPAPTRPPAPPKPPEPSPADLDSLEAEMAKLLGRPSGSDS
jgi:flagellar protein FliO/FliZ